MSALDTLSGVYPMVAGARLVAPRRALAIVGSHPVGLDRVPWDDPDVDIMVFNEAPLKPEKYPRWDMCLQIHAEEVYTSLQNWVNQEYWPWLQQDHGPDKTIWMQNVDPRVPNSAEYPLDAIQQMTPYRYLRSSPAMALALGIYLGYPEIQLFGSELTSNTEYAYQATNYAFWIGFAHGRGIDLKLNCWHAEFWQEIYGYHGELQLPRLFFQEREAELSAAYHNNNGIYEKVQNKLDAALLEHKYDEVAQTSIQLDGVAQVTGETFQAMTEAQRYLAREDMISRQEFERSSAEAQRDGEELRSKRDHAGGKTEYVWNAWKLTGQYRALEQLRVFLAEKRDLSYQVGQQLGKFRENITYMNEYDARLQAAGGKRALGRQ